SLTAWVSTQGIFDARRELARRFDLAPEQVRVISEYIGGAFGAKQGAGTEALLAAELARSTGRPVRLALGRHEEQVVGGRRAWTRQTVTLGARSDGTLAGDELAAALGLDPLELRRRNHVDIDQGSGLPYSSKRLLACYDRAAELAGWDGRDALREPHTDGLLRGMGCATQIWWGGGGPPAHATIRLDADGRALVTTGIQDIGTGTLTTARMVAAEELGLPLERVFARGGDTLPNVYSPVSGGSMTTPAVMPAV